MRLDKIDLNLFIVFEVIYREGNLTKAAKVLNITQPAVSNALSRLRNTFDDPLFERKSDSMKPTAFAQNLIAPVREALWLLNNGIVSKDRFDPESAKRVMRISMSDLSSALILRKLIPTLRQQAPSIILDIQPLNRDDVIDQLSSTNLEFSIEAPDLIDQRISHASLFSEEYVCVVRKNHSILQQKFDLAAYLSLDHIHTSSNTKVAGHIDRALNRMGQKRKIKIRLQNYLVAPKLLMETDLALTVPRSLADSYDLETLELPFEVPQMEVNLYWNKNKDDDPANKWLRELLFSIFTKEDAKEFKAAP